MTVRDIVVGTHSNVGKLRMLPAQSWADVGQSPLDPFSLVADEISSVSERLRRTIMSDIPVLSKAAEYFFQVTAVRLADRPTRLNMP